MLRPAVPALVVALLAGACGSTPEPEPAPRVVREPVELSPAERELVAAYDQGGEAWELARVRALEDPALERFLVDHLVLDVVRTYEALVGGGGGGDRRAAFERSQAELVRLGERSAPVLAGLLALSDSIVAALAATTLERIGRPAVASVVPLTRAAPPRTRLRAAELLGDLPHAGGEEDEVRRVLIDLVGEDPEWTVRAQAARALGARGARDRATEPARRALEAALRDPDPAVTEAAAAGLAVLRDPLCVPALLRRLEVAVEAGDLRNVRACQEALTAATGGVVERDLEGWRRWWYEHRDELQRRQGQR